MGNQNQVLGRGKLYFELYAPGTFIGQGERYLGNTPSLSLRAIATGVDEFDSTDETKEKTETTIIQRDLAASFTADDVSNENLSAWFATSRSSITQGAADNQTETLTLFPDRWYQLGRDANPIMGLRNVANVRASIAAAPLNNTLNFRFDRSNGRLYVLPDAQDVETTGTEVDLVYDLGSSARQTLIYKTQKIRGALRYIADNTEGNNPTYYFPYVVLRPESDFSLKADDWQKLGFTVDVLKMDPATDRVYLESEVTSIGFTNNEQQALGYGTEAEIIAWCNDLEYVIDTQLPAIHYP